MACALLVLLAGSASADQLRFDSRRDWRDWQVPVGAVQIAASGAIQPVRVQKGVDAVRDAPAFGGGIHRAGSNPNDARALLDGNPATGWAPNPTDDPADWFVEIDLGRSVSAHSIALVFADDAPPFELFDLLLSAGEPQLDHVANPVAGSLIYRIKERFKENTRHRVAYAPGDALYLTPIRYLQIRNLKHVPNARLVAVEVESIGDNLILNLIERGGAIDVVIDAFVRAEEVTLGNALNLVDGSIFDRWRNGREPRNTYNTYSHITIDLGAVYPVDFVRLITGVAIRGGFGEHLLRTRAGASGSRSFSYKNYEVLTSDGTSAPDGTRIWTRHFAGEASSENHNAGLADHQFPTLPARYVRIVWLIWDAACAAALPDASSRWGCYANGSAEEIQVYGEGYPLAVRLHSPLIDLGRGKNLNSIEWQAQTPLGTHIEIRSRTGNEVVEQYTFYDKNGRQVSEKRYGKLIPSFKGKIDTTRIAGADWSPYSNLYRASGAAFLSPSPRCFMELDVRLVSDSPTQAPRFDWLAVNFSDPLAAEVVGEVFPLEVAPGQRTLFSYFLRPATTQDGFDRIAIEASTVPHFDAALVDGERVEVAVETLAQGFRATFPRRIRSRQLVELRFTAPVYVQATRFDAFLEDSQKTPTRQLVDPGDASPQVESSSNIVRLPIADQLFADLSFSPALITPNGDGINDQLRISFDLINVLSARPLHLRIYDLSGQPLFIQEQAGQAGDIAYHWAGRDLGGQRVPPGLYIAELQVTGDAGERSARRVVAVAY